MLSIQVL